MNIPSTFWSLPTDQVLQQTNSTSTGLSRQDAQQRLSTGQIASSKGD